MQCNDAGSGFDKCVAVQIMREADSRNTFCSEAKLWLSIRSTLRGQNIMFCKYLLCNLIKKCQIVPKCERAFGCRAVGSGLGGRNEAGIRSKSSQTSSSQHSQLRGRYSATIRLFANIKCPMSPQSGIYHPLGWAPAASLLGTNRADAFIVSI